MEMSSNTTVITISQYISVSNENVVHLKLTRCYLAFYLNKAGKNKCKEIFKRLLPFW